ncbi:MAG: TonB-dependent receptor [Fidelibacterota bacterium]|nr:MAG: TonB-dependent receptor [Candidatus Neomarinimicrobiota bacterium]
MLAIKLDTLTNKDFFLHKILPSLLCILIGAGVLHAQAGTISGFVRDSTNHESLSFVNVFVKGTERGAATNRDGYFVITSLPRDTLEVIASIIGYAPASRRIDLREQDHIRLDFQLAPTVLAGEEVTITAQRQRFRQSVEVSTVTLDTREIKVAPAFVEADVFRTLQLLPGVQSISDYSSALYVRGSTPDQNLILLDGIPVYNPFHLGGVFSTFNTEAIKEAEFIAGGFSARYGGRMGSVLEIINRDGNARELSGQANISLISSKLLAEGPLPQLGALKGSFMLAGRRTYFDQIVDAVAYATGHAKKRGYVGFPYYFYDLQAKANLDLGDRHRVTVSLFKGRDVLKAVDKYDSETPDRYLEEDIASDVYKHRFAFDWSWGNTTRSIAWRWVVSPRLVSKVYLAGSRFRYGILTTDYSYDKIIYDDGVVSESSRENRFEIFDLVGDQTGRVELTYLPNSRHTILAGATRKWLHFNLGWTFAWRWTENGRTESRKDTSLWMDYRPVEQAIYLEDKWQVAPRLLVKAGLRTSSYSLHDDWDLEPRLGAKLFLRSDLALTASAGRYYQYLTTANPGDENFRVIDLWLPTPSDRSAPLSDHFITGVEYLTSDDLLLKVEAYVKSFTNLVYLEQGYYFFMEPDAEPGMEVALSEFHPARAAAYGLEFLAKKSSGKIRGWIGYTYAQTRWRTAEHGWYAPKYDRTHTLNLVADWQLSEKWHFSTACSYATGNPYTPILARYIPFEEYYGRYWEEHFGTSGEWFLLGGKNSARYPSYQRWDVSFVKRRPMGKTGSKEVYFQILNVLNHMNVFQYFYTEKYDPKANEDLGIQRSAIPMFPIFPTIGVRYEF